MLTRALQTPGAWLAVVLGLAFSLMPTVGPFVAVLLLIGQPIMLGRQDALWILAALISGLPAFINDGVAGLFQAGGPIVAAWVVYRAFSHLPAVRVDRRFRQDRKSTRLNSSHVRISYAVFCLKKKNQCAIRECSTDEH